MATYTMSKTETETTQSHREMSLMLMWLHNRQMLALCSFALLLGWPLCIADVALGKAHREPDKALMRLRWLVKNTPMPDEAYSVLIRESREIRAVVRTQRVLNAGKMEERRCDLWQ